MAGEHYPKPIDNNTFSSCKARVRHVCNYIDDAFGRLFSMGRPPVPPFLENAERRLNPIPRSLLMVAGPCAYMRNGFCRDAHLCRDSHLPVIHEDSIRNEIDRIRSYSPGHF